MIILGSRSLKSSHLGCYDLAILWPTRSSAMPLTPSPAQAEASRTNGVRSHGPVTEAGKARAAQNRTRHGLRGGDFGLLPGEDGEELALLERAVAADWQPCDA